MKIFKDRQSAGKLLAKRLADFKNRPDTIVLGIPRGGVVVAKEVADELKLPLDIVITRKIGAPNQRELALGAVDPDEEVVWDKELLEELRVQSEELRIEVEKQKEEVKRREEIYRKGKEPLDISGKIVILVDDGIATGSTAISAIRYLRRHRVNKIILAVPVGSKQTLIMLEPEVDELVVLYAPEAFGAVGEFYQNFESVPNKEIVEILSKNH